MKLSTKKVLGMVLAGVLAAGSLTARGGSDTASTTAADTAAVASGDSQAVTDTTAATGEKKTLRVAIGYAYVPYNWAQPDGSNSAIPIADSNEFAYGYDVMITKKIRDELGYGLEIIRPNWGPLVPAVTTGEVDCVVTGQSIASERLQAVDSTESYYCATIVALVKEESRYAGAKSAADLTGATYASRQSTIWCNTCLPQTEGTNILTATVSAPDILMSLNADGCDLVMADQPTGRGTLVTYPNFKVIRFGDGENDFRVADEDINIGISSKKGNIESQDAINNVLTKMARSDLPQMIDKTVSVQPLAN